jgi:RNA polymerase sigma-70 factor, ECF subfamily
MEEVSLRERSWSDALRAERLGDVAAYERLLKEVATMVRRLVRSRLTRLGLNVNETEDLVQEVLIGLHAKRHTWDEQRPVLPWLYAIAHYKMVDAVRRLRREARYRTNISVEDLADSLEAPALDLDRATLDVEKSLAGLPQHQQDVLRSVAIDGVSVRMTAQKLQTSEGAVRVTYHRALKQLMQTFRARNQSSSKDQA